MSEAPARQSVVVGLFVAVGAALLMGGVLLLGSLGGGFRRSASVHAVFDDVQGLGVASDVWFSGVKVGTVKEVRFHEGSSVAVELAVGRDALGHIPADARARISSDALLGDAIVVLEDGTAGGPALAEGQTLATTETPTTEDLFATLQRNNENLLAVTEDLRAITEALAAGEGTVGKLLADETLYLDLREGVSSLQAASGEARVLASTLSGLARDLEQGDAADTLVRSARNLEQVTVSAVEVTDELGQRVASDETPVGVLLNDEEVAADLKSTVDELERGSRLLSEDLEALQHNFLLRGFFKRRDKERERAGEEPVPAEEPPAEEPPPEPEELPPVTLREAARGS